MPRYFRTKRRPGFTLVELMIATGVAALVLAGVLPMFIRVLILFKFDSFRLEIDGNMRKLTSTLTTDATYANYSLIFTSFTSTRTTGTGSATVLNNVTDGNSGDFLVLVFKDSTDDTKVSKIIGYLRDTSSGTTSACIRRFTTTFSPSSTATSAATVAALLPATTTTLSTYTQIVPDSTRQGLGVGTTAAVNLISGNAGIFYNYYNNSVIVNAQIQYSSSDHETNQTATTYNLTISPRG